MYTAMCQGGKLSDTARHTNNVNGREERIYEGDQEMQVLSVDQLVGRALGVPQQQTRVPPPQPLDMLKQLAASMDYAHSKGVTHGILSLTTALVSNQLTLQSARFRPNPLLQVHGNTQIKQPQAHLFRESGAC